MAEGCIEITSEYGRIAGVFEHPRICTLRDGRSCCIRVIRPTDKALLIDFHSRLSDESVYQRYFRHVSLSQRVAEEELNRICCGDHGTNVSIVATRTRKDTGMEEVIGLAEVCMGQDHSAEWGIVVSDECRGLGLGEELCNELLSMSVKLATGRIVSYMMPDNIPVISIARKLGFHLQLDVDEGVLRAELDLTNPKLCQEFHPMLQSLVTRGQCERHICTR
jgi:acetyltransferase